MSLVTKERLSELLSKLKGILDTKIPLAQKGAAGGIAELDQGGKVPTVQLPSFVDDVVEGYLSGGKLYKEAAHTTQITGETGKIYVDMATNKTYRWSGSAFVEISASLALGTTSATAFRGDQGKIAYDHSQSAHAPANAEANVQSDWNMTNSASDAFIKNKPGAMSGASSGAAGKTGFVPAPAAGKQTAFLRGDGTWAVPANTTYNVATQTANGLMSAADKKKLDGMAEMTATELDQLFTQIFG